MAQFKSRYDARPTDPEAAFLYAYTLVNRDTAKAVEILTSLTQKTPSFPLPWITLAILHGYPGFSYRAKQRTYAEGYLARCPNSFETRVVFLATQLEKSEALATYAKALREHLAGKADARSLSLYRFLLQIETKVTPPAEQAQQKLSSQSPAPVCKRTSRRGWSGARLILCPAARRRQTRTTRNGSCSSMSGSPASGFSPPSSWTGFRRLAQIPGASERELAEAGERGAESLQQHGERVGSHAGGSKCGPSAASNWNVSPRW